jgi:hypothetical protein
VGGRPLEGTTLEWKEAQDKASWLENIKSLSQRQDDYGVIEARRLWCHRWKGLLSCVFLTFFAKLYTKKTCLSCLRLGRIVRR